MAQNKDELLKQRILSVVDDVSADWIKEKFEEYSRLMTYYRCAMMEIETKFNVLNEEYSLAYDRNPISSIKTRLKSFPSISEKLVRKGVDNSIESIERNLNDIAGVRVICSFPEDVYELAKALLKQDDIMLIEEKDYIKNPKPNGYRSLHMIVGIPIFLAHEKRIMKVEIQLRTIAMDFWASLEHQLRYKKDTTFTKEMANELYECAEISAMLDDKMDTLQKKVLSDNN
ncbi:MAG: GTP pyrophosphokinase family protein [Ruminococcaceae bacterium]|nr:GTP pyrophosphokinase family protein [Oscillospiraceae bacterium]